MKKEYITVKEDKLNDYVLKNFQEGALLEISYNRVFIPGKILYMEGVVITLQLMGQLLNQRVDINIDEVKSELVEIIYSKDEKTTVISIID